MRRVGVATRCARDLDECVEIAAATTLAFVLFPDGFRWERVVMTLAGFAAERPDVLPISVTGATTRAVLVVTEGALIDPIAT